MGAKLCGRKFAGGSNLQARPILDANLRVVENAKFDPPENSPNLDGRGMAQIGMPERLGELHGCGVLV